MEIKNKVRPDGYKPHTMSTVFYYWNGDEEIPVKLEFSIKCPNCASDWVRECNPNKQKNDEPRYKCNECEASFQYNKRYKRCRQLFQISRLVNKNCSQEEIARELKTHHSTIKKYVDRYNLREVCQLPGFQLPIRKLREPQDKQCLALFNHGLLIDYLDVLMKYYDYDYHQVIE